MFTAKKTAMLAVVLVLLGLVLVACQPEEVVVTEVVEKEVTRVITEEVVTEGEDC